MSANRNNLPPKMEECIRTGFKTIKNNGQIGHMSNACMFISVGQACELCSQSRPSKTLYQTVVELRIKSGFPNKSIPMEIGGQIGGQSAPHDACLQKLANITQFVIHIYCANNGGGENKWICHSPSIIFIPENSQPVATIAIVSLGYHYELIVSATATTSAINLTRTDYKVREFFAGSSVNKQNVKHGDKSGVKPIVVKVKQDSKQDGKAGAIQIVPCVNNKDGKAGGVPNVPPVNKKDCKVGAVPNVPPVNKQGNPQDNSHGGKAGATLDQKKESKEEYKRLLADYRATIIQTEDQLKLVLTFVSESRSELCNATKKAHDDASKYLTDQLMLDIVMGKNKKILEAIQAVIENGETLVCSLNKKLAWLHETLCYITRRERSV